MTSRKSWVVYMVRCRDGSLYTGCTNDLERRVATHNAGKGARYTRSRRPVTLVWKRRVKDRSRALSLEARLKRLTRAEKLALIRLKLLPARASTESHVSARRPAHSLATLAARTRRGRFQATPGN